MSLVAGCRWLAVLAVVCLVELAHDADPAHAQGWREDRTDRSLVLSAPGAEAGRETVLDHLEALRTTVSNAVGLVPDDEPITVWVYGSEAALLADKPLVVAAGADLAYPRRSRRDLLLLAGEGRSEERLLRSLRHELAHRALGVRSEGRLPEGFQEGLAAYLAGVGPDQAAGVARLREAWSRNALVPWADLAVPGAAYLEPERTYPQSRSIAQFLLDVHGLVAVHRWLDVSAQASGWRQAMELAFGQPPAQLEAAWSAWLPAYLDGGWRSQALLSADVAPAEQLLAQGAFAAAAAQAAGMGALDPAAAARSEALRLRAEAGLQGSQRLADGRTALEAGEFAAALEAAGQAASLLRESGDAAAVAVAEEMARRAQLGVASLAALQRGESLPAWRSVEARTAVAGALDGLSALGHDAAADRSRAVLQALDRRLVPAGLALCAAGGGLLVWNVRRRRHDALSDGVS